MRKESGSIQWSRRKEWMVGGGSGVGLTDSLIKNKEVIRWKAVGGREFGDDFNSFLIFAATTLHEFIITGDFNIHLDNATDHVTTQFLSLLCSFNLCQHVNFPTHNKNHLLDLVITSSDFLLRRPRGYDS